VETVVGVLVAGILGAGVLVFTDGGAGLAIRSGVWLVEAAMILAAIQRQGIPVVAFRIRQTAFLAEAHGIGNGHPHTQGGVQVTIFVSAGTAVVAV
jgi:hypothetical protein